jgi:catechol 2,3-dioxygenase-like lactoylglutathione lyase family enzyme
MFRAVHPIIGSRDVDRSIEFYTGQLGFKIAFRDRPIDTNYLGFRRGSVEVHMQFQFEYEMAAIRLRFLVEDPDVLFAEYQERSVECTEARIRNTPWGTREFALYDPDRNALEFYCGLRGRDA